MIDPDNIKNLLGVVIKLLFVGVLFVVIVSDRNPAYEFYPSDQLPSPELIDRVLSGEDSFCVEESCDVIKTRYTYTQGRLMAERYLTSLITSVLGYNVVVQQFILRVQKPDLVAVAVSTASDTVWVGGAVGRLYRGTRDFQGDWTFEHISSINGEIYGLEYANGKLWSASGLTGGGYGALFVSNDGGKSWENVAPAGIRSLYDVEFGSDSFGMACGAFGTLIISIDGGNSWGMLSPDNFSYRSIRDLSACGPTHFWCVTYNGEAYETLNLGVSWRVTTFEGYPLLNAVDFCDSLHGAIAGDKVIYLTRDGGQSWEKVSAAVEFMDIVMADTSRIVAVGRGGVIWTSSDGGRNWNDLSSFCGGQRDIKDVFSRDGMVFWVCGGEEVGRLNLDGEINCEVSTIVDTTWGRNILFEKKGCLAPDSIVVLCAHYDSFSKINPELCAPGADDNGTGVVTVLHTAGILKDVPLRYTVQFILFDGEEVGLRGSEYFASHLDSSLSYICAINVDMIGYNGDGVNSLTLVGRSGEVMDSLIVSHFEQSVDSLGLELVCDPEFGANYASDHLPFWEQGIPAVLLIEGRRGEWNPNYHSCNDTYEHVDFDFVGECILAVADVVERFAGRGGCEGDVLLKRPLISRVVPNPSSGRARIFYEIPRPSYVELILYDVLGRRVCVVDGGIRYAGKEYEILMDITHGQVVSSGIYFIRLKTYYGSSVKKVVVIK